MAVRDPSVGRVVDPGGGALQMTEVLPSLPVPGYTLAGLFLLVVMGAAPLLLAYGLLARPAWAWAEPLLRAGQHRWAWSGTLAPMSQASATAPMCRSPGRPISG